jgi:hypothetical protein
MPRRPGGGRHAPDTIEAGLRDIALGAGPDVRALARQDTDGMKRLMSAAAPPAGWDPDAAAAAVLEVIGERVDAVTNPRWRAAGQAALRRPLEHYTGQGGDSLAQRFKRRAELDRGRPFDTPEDATRANDSYRAYWMACAVQLAEELQAEFARMAMDPLAWDRLNQQAPPAPPMDLPISFRNTDVLYQFRGRVGLRSTSYRWLVAHDYVDHYNAVGWYYNEPDAPVEIVPLANCEITTASRELPLGGRTARLEFGRTLTAGEEYFFAYATVFNSTHVCRPAILYEVRGRYMNRLMVRAQFDRDELPELCWYLDVELHPDNDSWQPPRPDAPEVLQVADNGYLEHEFLDCKRGRRYGVCWTWRHR